MEILAEMHQRVNPVQAASPEVSIKRKLHLTFGSVTLRNILDTRSRLKRSIEGRTFNGNSGCYRLKVYHVVTAG
jgi:hypothetical protein